MRSKKLKLGKSTAKTFDDDNHKLKHKPPAFGEVVDAPPQSLPVPKNRNVPASMNLSLERERNRVIQAYRNNLDRRRRIFKKEKDTKNNYEEEDFIENYPNKLF